MGQRVRKSHRGIKVPSSSGQLPVPVALDARSPTLFSAYYTRFDSKCKEFFSFLSYFFPSSGVCLFPRAKPVVSFPRKAL